MKYVVMQTMMVMVIVLMCMNINCLCCSSGGILRPLTSRKFPSLSGAPLFITSSIASCGRWSSMDTTPCGSSPPAVLGGLASEKYLNLALVDICRHSWPASRNNSDCLRLGFCFRKSSRKYRNAFFPDLLIIWLNKTKNKIRTNKRQVLKKSNETRLLWLSSGYCVIVFSCQFWAFNTSLRTGNYRKRCHMQQMSNCNQNILKINIQHT